MLESSNNIEEQTDNTSDFDANSEALGESTSANDDASTVDEGVGNRIKPDEDKRLQWIFQGMDCDLKYAFLSKAGDEAGADAGNWFYHFQFSECTLAIRADCMKAYLISVSKLAAMSRVSELVSQCNFRELQEPLSAQIRESLMGSVINWLELSTGVSPQSTRDAVFYRPGKSDRSLERETLECLSSELVELLAADSIPEEKLLEFRSIAVSPREIIAKANTTAETCVGKDIFGRPLPRDHYKTEPKAGANVTRNGDDYLATRYGYVTLCENELSVVSPVFITQDAMAVHWILLDRRAVEVSPDMIDEWLMDCRVFDDVDREVVEQTASEVASGKHCLGSRLIASGLPPVKGTEPEVIILVDLARGVGEVRKDGSIDFRGTNFEPNIHLGQEIAQLIPGMAGVDGRNVRGDTIECKVGPEVKFKPGAAVRVETDEDGIEHYYSEIGGSLKLTTREVAVVETLIIDRNVGFDTGNLEFKGEVIVKGSIGQGFTVKASGDVVVFGTVEDAAAIASGGNISVGRGISGRKTRVVAIGDIRTQFVHDAEIRCRGNIVIGDYVHQATLRTDGKILVNKGSGRRAGSIVGGRVWSMKGIECHTGGSPSSATTQLAAGIDPDQARNLDLLSRKIDESNRHIARQLSRFHLQRVDVGAIQRLLAASTGPQKKILVRAAKQLGEMVQQHRELTLAKKEIEDGMAKGLAGAYIAVMERVYPGVEIRIGDYNRKVTSEMDNPRFHVRRNLLVER